MNISNNVSKAFRMAAAVFALVPMLAYGMPAPAGAQALGDERCTMSATDACVDVQVSSDIHDRITIKYWGNQNFDFYRLRWSRDGATEKVVNVRGRGTQGSQWILKNTSLGSTYTFKVQACFGKSAGLNCTAWQETMFFLPANGIHAQ
jgi:hypothetical protein